VIRLDHGLLEIGISVEVVLGEVDAVVFVGFAEPNFREPLQEREGGEREGDRQRAD
jgi:hypothetical protein